MIRTDKNKPRTTDNGQTLLCSYCDDYKPCTDFPKRSDDKYHRAYECSGCYRMHHPLSKPKRIATETHAECTKCKQIKLHSEFRPCAELACGLESHCKDCTNARENNRLKAKRRPAIIKRYRTGGFNRYIKHTIARGYTFNLSLEQFWDIKNKPCVYCGQEPDPKKGNGIDRVNNDIGYELNNCVPCCTPCNLMKRTLSLDDFLARILKIAKRITEGHTPKNA